MNTLTRRTLVALGLLLGVASPASAASMSASAASEREAEGAEAEAPPALDAVLLGRFVIRDLRAIEGSKLRISFALYAEVSAENEARLQSLSVSHEHRIHNEVLVAVRTCEQHDFQEPELEMFRRRVMARLRRAMPILPIEGLLVGEFEFFAD